MVSYGHNNTISTNSPQKLLFQLRVTPVDSYIPNRTFNDPGLMRFDQTDGKIVPNGVETEGGYPSLLTKPFQHQLHRGLPHGVWGLSNRADEHKPQIARY